MNPKKEGTYYSRNREKRLAQANAYRASLTQEQKDEMMRRRKQRYRDDDEYRLKVQTYQREYARNKKQTA